MIMPRQSSGRFLMGGGCLLLHQSMCYYNNQEACSRTCCVRKVLKPLLHLAQQRAGHKQH